MCLTRIQGESERISGRVELLEAILFEPFYDELRTKQQLGYNVYFSYRATETVDGVSVLVESAKYGAEKLNKEMDLFLQNVPRLIKGNTDESKNVIIIFNQCFLGCPE